MTSEIVTSPPVEARWVPDFHTIDRRLPAATQALNAWAGRHGIDLNLLSRDDLRIEREDGRMYLVGYAFVIDEYGEMVYYGTGAKPFKMPFRRAIASLPPHFIRGDI